VELWEAGNTQEAFAVFHDLLQRHPEYLDVRDSLAHVCEEISQGDRAKVLLEEAVALGRRAFPKAFWEGDRLEACAPWRLPWRASSACQPP
jgi:hypothetical protein